MRKRSCIFIALAMAVSLTACSSKTADKKEEPAATAKTTEKSADTSDPYKSAGSAETSDPYKNAGQPATNAPYKNAGQPATSDPYKNAETSAAQTETQTEAQTEKEAAGSYIPEPGEGAKYTVTVTDDGWVKIENEDSETLGLSSGSGVKIVEEDGYAFKDMNQNGKLDVYEDWRKSSEERAADLTGQM